MNNNDSASVLTPNELLTELHTLVGEAEAMFARFAAAPSSSPIESLRARFGAVQESVAGAYTKARKNVVAGAKYTDETIRANPYQSLAIAAGAGLLVGVLIGRRSQ
jgi:ElaB/YqjD/DUF883 family membrane-anchored ribosome-binding protein